MVRAGVFKVCQLFQMLVFFPNTRSMPSVLCRHVSHIMVHDYNPSIELALCRYLFNISPTPPPQKKTSLSLVPTPPPPNKSLQTPRYPIIYDSSYCKTANYPDSLTRKHRPLSCAFIDFQNLWY